MSTSRMSSEVTPNDQSSDPHRESEIEQFQNSYTKDERRAAIEVFKLLAK